MTDLSFTTTNFRAHMIEMRRNGDLVMRVTYEGKVEIGDGYAPSEAGDAFIAELPAAFGRATAAAEKAGYERGLREAAEVAKDREYSFKSGLCAEFRTWRSAAALIQRTLQR